MSPKGSSVSKATSCVSQVMSTKECMKAADIHSMKNCEKIICSTQYNCTESMNRDSNLILSFLAYLYLLSCIPAKRMVISVICIYPVDPNLCEKIFIRKFVSWGICSWSKLSVELGDWIYILFSSCHPPPPPFIQRFCWICWNPKASQV